MNHGSLLLVDDDPLVLESMADYLRSLGHRTETAQNCLDAIQRIKEYSFDAVVCDVNLPDQDGFRLLEWATQSAPETQVILLTGFGTVRDDDPQLNVRGVETDRQPMRILVDSRLETRPTARLFDREQAGPVLVACAIQSAERKAALEARGAEVLCLPDARGKVDLSHGNPSGKLT
jgi:CheY-like chemotaxis protein